nr:hypothetical protein [Tanacetum cinerariifolium]
TKDIRNTKAYKEYYACATGEAAPKPKASAGRKRGGSASSTTPPTPIATPTPLAALRLTAAAKGKQPARATSPTEPSDVERTEAEQLKIVLRRSRHETHISQQGGSSTDEGTDSMPGVPDVPSDDSKEEISWNSFDDEDVDDQTKGSDEKKGEKTKESYDDDDDQDEAEKVNDDDDDEEEISKIDEQEATESGEGDDEETESDGESEEEETTEKEKESFDPIPRTPKESEDDSNGMESIFTTGSSSVTPIPSPKSTMTPSIMTTTTTVSQPQIPPTQTLPTFASVFRFEDRVKSLEVNFSKLIRTNQKDPSLDQTGGLRDEEKEGSMHQPALHLNQLPGVQAGLLQGLNLDSCLPVQTINPLFKLLSILNGSPSQGNHQHRIVIGQSWISALAKQTDARSSFNELLDTPIDFSNFIMNRLGVDTLTPELLAGPTYELIRGSCNSLTELEYYLEEVYKATTDQLD